MNIRQLIALVRKNIELYFNKGPVIIFGLLFPFFLCLAWILGRSIPAEHLISALIAISVFFSGTAISPVIFPWETREKNLEIALSAPISLWDIIFGVAISSMIYSIILTLAISIIFVIGLGISIILVGWAFIGLVLMSWISSFIGVLMSAVPTDRTANIMIISSLVKFPLVFISGIFIPINQVSGVLLILALCSPITYFIDYLYGFFGINTLMLTIDITVLIIWAVALAILTYLAHKRTILKRFS